MDRALELAGLGLGTTSPNPMVGCVIVKNDKIIGEGWHRKSGEAHAEVNAINSIKDKNTIENSDVYVTLEPCSHTGKTPPCADLLIKHKVRNVYIANKDPNPLVCGNGIKKLEDAGIKVFQNIMDEDGKKINKRFFNFHAKNRPYVILKWAQTADGFIARTNFDSKWISNEYSRQLVHKWRSEEDAIMIGANTAMYDNPSLSVRDWEGRNPIRIIIDPNLKVPEQNFVFDKSVKTYVYNYLKKDIEPNLEFIKVEQKYFLENILAHMHSEGIQSVLVEGGTFLLNDFFKTDMWDEAMVFISNTTFGNGIEAPQMLNAELVDQIKILDDQLNHFIRKNANG